MMLTADGPQVLEFNCRFGDPETQPIMCLLESDLAELALACAEGRLGDVQPRWSGRSALCVVLASGGYPGKYRKGLPISGNLAGGEDAVVFHAGTRFDNGQVVTAGGRVLGVTGLGDDLGLARDRAYAAVREISFDDMYYRRDIGYRGIERLGS
jgi:phosphoribosylamine--glycine ligase